jgi:hypothetical protein
MPSRHNWQGRTERRRGGTLHYAACDCGCGQMGAYAATREQADLDAVRMQREDGSL